MLTLHLYNILKDFALIFRSLCTEKVCDINFFLYRLMVRPQEQNYILRSGKLYHQYVVDMYAKIVTERPNLVRINQAKLRYE